MNKKSSVWTRIKAYKLKNNCIVMIFLVLIVIISFIIYIMPEGQENAIVGNIALACFTSLLATIFAMCAEIYVQFKTHENDQFLEDMQVFGIANLNQNKEELLKELLKDCDKEIWISGYRLILTNHISSDISTAIKRGASVKCILCPPWTDAFRLVYGEHEKVMSNYFQVLHAISATMRENGRNSTDFDVRFTTKPLFNDTYKVDQHLVTGPYMHNRDEKYNRIMAKDFFSYNLIRESTLYKLVKNEYITLEDEADLVLNWKRFDEAYQEFCVSDYNEKEKIDLLLRACDTRK